MGSLNQRARTTRGRGILPFLLLMALLAGCEAKSEEAAAAPPPPPEVDVVNIVAQPVVLSESFTGRVEAAETVELRSRVSGYIEEVAFEEGELVEQGDLLFQIDPRPIRRGSAPPRLSLPKPGANWPRLEAKPSGPVYYWGARLFPRRCMISVNQP